ncbi:hypothetical protein OPQ81_009542 [Rhizoctonia solani]|nr:hypothetical protein OPQ81_009542 [Rhizoctonia solani]
MLSERRPTTATGRISAFLESQRGLMAYYAAEGKSVSATWLKESSGDSRSGSPMLAPRAAAAKDDRLRSNASPDKLVPAFSRDMHESSISQSKKPRPANSSTSTRAVPVKSRASQRKSVDQVQCSDDEPERLQRLEHRRKRRQTRRYAMGVAESATERGDKASEMDLSCKTNNKRQKLQSPDKMNKKRRKAKVTPALLLMQNFSSQSLGKSRLTVRPSPTVGVFNKGKNSGKITNKGERAGKLVSDIVFSESRFLNKASSARSSDGDTGDDSDASGDHSAHSLTERARLDKNRQIRSSQHPSHKVIVDQISCSGSPVHSSRSIREESPPWDIEEIAPSSPSSAKSVSRSSDKVYSANPTVQKDVIINTKYSVWASKLRDPGPRTPTMPDNVGSAPGSYLPGAPSAQPRTTSAYFVPIRAPGEPQIPVAPPIELDKLVDKHQRHQPISCPVAAPDPVNPPSTPECLWLEDAHLLSVPENASTGTPRMCMTPNNIHSPCFLQPATHLQDSDVQFEWEYEIDSEPKRGLQDCYIPEPTKSVEWTNERIWNDSDIPGWSEYHSDGVFPLEEVEFHEVHSHLDYDGLSLQNKGEYCTNDTEYPYVDSKYVYETKYLGGNTQGYELQRVDDSLEYGSFEEGSLAGLGNHNSYMEVTQEQESYHPIKWSTVDDLTMEHPDPAWIDPELDERLVEDGLMEAEDEWAEYTPRLVHVITEASLQDDLIKSTSRHWSTAHRLY